MGKTVIRGKGQVTIPSSIRRAACLEEGDPVEFELVADGILIRPKKVIDSTQAWFWTPAWQAGEREAADDLNAGRSRVFESSEEFLASLDDE
ncbi:MAG: AbrB/MazE/SpoVT family DNA-binding domain-containing protein [Gaiellaceae bacterium MAG52_C11]|nr:AbrB/MazE/SpoVT family DNA-binding domain-containing protein [Candidatus Gaiellasilicea maunaloa]